MKLGNIEECQNHATRKSHKKLKKVQTCYVWKDVFLSVTQAVQKKKSDLNTRKLMTFWLLVQKSFTSELVHKRPVEALVTKTG